MLTPPASTKQVLIYAKAADAGVMGSTAGFRRDAEAIYLIGKWPSGIGGQSSILKVGGHVAGPAGPAAIHGHPHSKPIGLMEGLVRITTGLIADPFAGSGATLVAAKNLGRNAIGVELEERYCEIIAKRCSQEVLDLGAIA
jgi:DNA modification methylase